NQFKYTSPAIQQSFSLSLSIPKSSILSFLETNKYFRNEIKSIKTNLLLSFLFEKNPDYLRRLFPLTYQYQIQAGQTTWYLNMFEMLFSKNTLNVDITNRTDSAFIRQLFSNNIITSTSINFQYNNRKTAKGRTHFYVRANLLEFSGNVHRVLRRLIDTENRPDTSYRLLNVNYYNFFKTEFDVRCSTELDEHKSTVIRFNAGMALPYGNQKITPFDKLFFIGGANSLRAWRPRTIGPGAFADDSRSYSIDRAGDIILQANAEYRFDFIDKKVELAFFVDAGNVWLIRK